MESIRLKRAYEPPEPQDGSRFLVDRLWPRGLKKDSLPLKGCIKEAAPSSGLRKWFNHDPAKWNDFCQRYSQELEHHPQVLEPIKEALKKGAVTLIYSAKDQEHNNAVALAVFLRGHIFPHEATRRGGER